MSFTDNINGIPAQDTVLRQGIATLRNTVISNTIKPLTVDHNGVYTANPNNGTYGYSPVTVDTGVYTGATAPDDSIGKDGDHYYQISKTRYGMKSVDNTYLTSSPMRILANEFYVTGPFKLTGIRIHLTTAVNVKYYVLNLDKSIIYESETIQGTTDWNEHTLTTPVTLVANQHYIIAANVQDKGTYTQNAYTTWNTEYVIFVQDWYSQTDSISGLRTDTVTCMVDPVLETDNEHVIAEYMKDNDTWVSISSAPKMILSTLSVTENGTYNAPTGTAYSSVSVDVHEQPWEPLEDGYSNFWFELTDDVLSPWLNFSAKTASAVIDWGDGSGEVALDTLSPTHTYSKAGRYIVKVKGVTGIGRQVQIEDTVRYPLVYAELANDVSSLTGNVFYECTYLKEVYFHNANISISYGCFLYCWSLEKIHKTSTQNTMFGQTFQSCKVFEGIDLTGTVTLSDNVFYDCRYLKNVTLPSTITNIKNNVFYGCVRLSEIHVQPTTPPTLGTGVFSNLSANYVIYVPVGCGAIYKAASGWSTYADHIFEEGQTPNIPMMANFNSDNTDDNEIR
jgi:hypothetical protein